MKLREKLAGSCDEVSRLVSEGMDRELSWFEGMRVRVHLLLCANCANFARQMQLLRGASRRLLERQDSR